MIRMLALLSILFIAGAAQADEAKKISAEDFCTIKSGRYEAQIAQLQAQLAAMQQEAAAQRAQSAQAAILAKSGTKVEDIEEIKPDGTLVLKAKPAPPVAAKTKKK